MKIRQLAATTLLTIVTLSASADDLLSIYQEALQNDPQYRAAAAEYKANQEADNQGWAPLLPQINLSASTTKNTQNVKSSSGIYPLGEKKYDTDSYTLSLSQAIYHHEYFVQLRQGNLRVAQAEANFRDARQELIARVAQRYFEYLGALDNLTFARAEKKAISQQLNQVRQRFKVGLTAITDVHEAKARYDQSVAQEISAQNLVSTTRENLREITGMAHDRIAALAKNSPLLRPNPQSVQKWVDNALQNSLTLIAADKARQIAEEEVNRIRAGHYPTLDLVAEKTNNDVTGGAFGARETEDTAVSLQLNLPIYSGGLVSSQTREAAARYMQSKEQYEQQRRAIERETRSAYLSVIANISQVKAYAQALESSQTALEATEAGFEVGTRTAVDVLNSQQELYRAERDYAKARYTYILESLRLRKATGILTDQDVKQVNAWLK